MIGLPTGSEVGFVFKFGDGTVTVCWAVLVIKCGAGTNDGSLNKGCSV